MGSLWDSATRSAPPPGAAAPAAGIPAAPSAGGSAAPSPGVGGSAPAPAETGPPPNDTARRWVVAAILLVVTPGLGLTEALNHSLRAALAALGGVVFALVVACVLAWTNSSETGIHCQNPDREAKAWNMLLKGVFAAGLAMAVWAGYLYHALPLTATIGAVALLALALSRLARGMSLRPVMTAQLLALLFVALMVIHGYGTQPSAGNAAAQAGNHRLAAKPPEVSVQRADMATLLGLIQSVGSSEAFQRQLRALDGTTSNLKGDWASLLTYDWSRKDGSAEMLICHTAAGAEGGIKGIGKGWIETRSPVCRAIDH